MKKVLLLVGVCLLLVSSTIAQTVSQRLQKSFQQFEADSQLKHAISSLYVIDAKTGEVVFDKNSQIGLAPASTQKIITSVTAFELLGKDFTYRTGLGVMETDNGSYFLIYPSYDPTFGSWRWHQTKSNVILKTLSRVLQKTEKSNLLGTVIIENESDSKIIPDGWIWQDIGNYYGAGSSIFNWRENQFDIILKSGKNIGDSVKVVELLPKPIEYDLTSNVVSAAKGSGDKAYVYYPITKSKGIITGTIPIGEDRFVISASTPSPKDEFINLVYDSLSTFFIKGQKRNIAMSKPEGNALILYPAVSPSLDSIIYWFNKKSINLYGEALIKTFAYEKQGFGSTDSGVAIVKKFWKEKGLGENELNMSDGSGLSPLNRVTTHAQVEILKYAKTKDWFQSFYNSLPIYNGMVMKSGTINDVKGFCGYHKAKDGREYIFSFLVNNYNGRTAPVVNKMYKVLDELK